MQFYFALQLLKFLCFCRIGADFQSERKWLLLVAQHLRILGQFQARGSNFVLSKQLVQYMELVTAFKMREKIVWERSS